MISCWNFGIFKIDISALNAPVSTNEAPMFKLTIKEHFELISDWLLQNSHRVTQDPRKSIYFSLGHVVYELPSSK